jgi:hypothetical protein
MAHHNGKSERSISRSKLDFLKEREKLLYHVETRRRISSEMSLLAQDLDQIFAEIAAAHEERVSLLKQLEGLIIEVNSTVIAANHKKPGQKIQPYG